MLPWLCRPSHRVITCYKDWGATDLQRPPGELNAHAFSKGTSTSCSRKMHLHKTMWQLCWLSESFEPCNCRGKQKIPFFTIPLSVLLLLGMPRLFFCRLLHHTIWHGSLTACSSMSQCCTPHAHGTWTIQLPHWPAPGTVTLAQKAKQLFVPSRFFLDLQNIIVIILVGFLRHMVMSEALRV